MRSRRECPRICELTALSISFSLLELFCLPAMSRGTEEHGGLGFCILGDIYIYMYIFIQRLLGSGTHAQSYIVALAWKHCQTHPRLGALRARFSRGGWESPYRHAVSQLCGQLALHLKSPIQFSRRRNRIDPGTPK